MRTKLLTGTMFSSSPNIAFVPDWDPTIGSMVNLYGLPAYGKSKRIEDQTGQFVFNPRKIARYTNLKSVREYMYRMLAHETDNQSPE